MPQQPGIGVCSPLLDPRGNSVRGLKVCTELSEHFRLHIFDSRADSSIVRAATSDRVAL
ncbi:MAG TPA: glutaminase [Roseiflexaceae bacterium]